MRGPEACIREPDAWIVRGDYKLALWSRAEGGYSWDVSYAGRVIASCKRYGGALVAVAAHQTQGVI